MKSSSPAKPRTKANLDLIDRKILSILRDEGRLTVNELANRVGLSSSPCWSRVRHLEEIGVIKHYAAVIDHAAIGLKDIVFIEVTLDKHDDKVLARFGDALARIPEVIEANLVTGDYDYLVKVGRRHYPLRALSPREALSDSRHPAHAIDLFAADSEARDFRRSAARQCECLALTAGQAVAGAIRLHYSPGAHCLHRSRAWPLRIAAGRRILLSRSHFLTANTQTTPPCGTLFSRPGTLPTNASWMRCASTPQPDWTAIYCVPSTS